MQIHGSALVHGPQVMASSPRGSTPVAPQSGSMSVADQLDISPAGELASRSLEGASRAEHVAQIRAAIQAGTYETAEKLDAAVDRLLDVIG